MSLGPTYHEVVSCITFIVTSSSFNVTGAEDTLSIGKTVQEYQQWVVSVKICTRFSLLYVDL